MTPTLFARRSVARHYLLSLMSCSSCSNAVIVSTHSRNGFSQCTDAFASDVVYHACYGAKKYIIEQIQPSELALSVPHFFLIVARMSLTKRPAPYWSLTHPFNFLTFGHSGAQKNKLVRAG